MFGPVTPDGLVEQVNRDSVTTLTKVFLPPVTLLSELVTWPNLDKTTETSLFSSDQCYWLLAHPSPSSMHLSVTVVAQILPLDG